MASDSGEEDHALLVIRAHAILSQIPRRVGDEVSVQGFKGRNARADPRNHYPDVRRAGCPYREGCVGARSCPHVPVNPAEVVPVRCHAAHQGPLIPPHPDGVSRPAQALLGQALLGAWVFLHDLRERDRRRDQTIPGITFLQMMPPASAGASFTPVLGCSSSGRDRIWWGLPRTTEDDQG